VFCWCFGFWREVGVDFGVLHPTAEEQELEAEGKEEEDGVGFGVRGSAHTPQSS
jgi:hypothetical protein